MNAVANRKNDEMVDRLEAAMVEEFSLLNCPLVHRFVPGMYIREIFMPKGALITSMIHLTTHPFTISKGKVVVLIDVDERLELEAPYTGITFSGTRRVLNVLEDCIWTTYHALPYVTGFEGTLSEEGQAEVVKWIEDSILDKHENPYLDYNKIKSLTAKQELCHS